MVVMLTSRCSHRCVCLRRRSCCGTRRTRTCSIETPPRSRSRCVAHTAAQTQTHTALQPSTRMHRRCRRRLLNSVCRTLRRRCVVCQAACIRELESKLATAEGALADHGVGQWGDAHAAKTKSRAHRDAKRIKELEEQARASQAWRSRVVMSHRQLSVVSLSLLLFGAHRATPKTAQLLMISTGVASCCDGEPFQ
jgi:hypothetical protein